jgi:formylglycine-generating enzyme required for sulfatase activity/tRNA A-37 threonylcarbamoyl transferase component Bud32
MIGRTISHFEILEKLGEGGMGAVYKARDTRLKRLVSLKFVSDRLSTHPGEREALKREAQLAASLNHPNVGTVYELDESDGEVFLVMEYLPGTTLGERLHEGDPLPLEQAFNFAVQIAGGLHAAHQAGLLHGDIKSGNIMVTPDGRIKIVDFGVARILGSSPAAGHEGTPGTVAYMSPEQARGEPLDHRTDIWSLGVVLYELFTGKLPFTGKYEQAITYAILHEKPRPPGRHRPDLPPGLDAIILRALEKSPAARFRSTEDLLQQLLQLQRSRHSGGVLKNLGGSAAYFGWKFRFAFAVAGMAVLASAVVLLRRTPEDPVEISRQLESLTVAGRYFEAFDLAEVNEPLLRNDPTRARLELVYADSITLESQPPGAAVWIQRLESGGGMGDKRAVGVTPVRNVRIARGEYLLTVAKDGFSTFRRVVASPPILKVFPIIRRGIIAEVRLLEADRTPPGMVFVPGGERELANWGIGGGRKVRLDDYCMDENEVSNEQFMGFISAGGYQRREFWRHTFVKDGLVIPWEAAMREFVDRTRMPGPRAWTGQGFPEGKGHHPVTDVTWYEAAAYAAFAGKRLPTAFEWEKAARAGAENYMGFDLPWGMLRDTLSDLRDRANFDGTGTVPVDSYDRGISPYGCRNMAGNAKEWLANPTGDGFMTAGGSWQEPFYMFTLYGNYPGFYSAPDLGFRCSRTVSGSGDQGAMLIRPDGEPPVYRPVSRSEFRTLMLFHRYDHRPVESVVRSSGETGDWTKIHVEFSAPYEERIPAFLYLPKLSEPPYQCIVFDPHSAVYFGPGAADDVAEHLAGSHVRSGRAVFTIVPKGSPGRQWESRDPMPSYGSVVYRERILRWIRENRRGVDYLATRGDIDTSKLALLTLSKDDGLLIIPALENRYASVILNACGLSPETKHLLPEVNPVNFLHLYRVPTLLLNGRYDEACPPIWSARPLFDQLPEPKQLQLVTSGHAVPIEIRVPAINAWLDRTLGPVRFRK